MSVPKHVIRVRGIGICCIPKCANTSIKAAVLQSMGYDPEALLRGGALHRHPALNLGTRNEVGALYVAAFVRHPVARLVSAWADKIARHDGRATDTLVKLGFRVGMPFAEFAWLACQNAGRDVHIRPQVDFVARHVNLLGRVETLDRDWRRLRDRCPWLPALGRWQATGADWRDCCDEQTAALICGAYEEDWTLWRQAGDRGGDD